MLRSLRNLFRLLVIARVLARYDALSLFEELGVAPGLVWAGRLFLKRRAGRPGEKLAEALNELGPSFIKLGQFLSTRADLVGEALAADLARLQDRLPPFSSEAARATVEEELGATIGQLFQSFDDEPISAASIAQVHLATVETGAGEPRPDDEAEGGSRLRQVAVKVLRPGIEGAFRRDLELFYWLAELAERTQPRLRRLKPVAVVGVFAETVRVEMDLRMEAAAASELATNFADDETYRVPAVDWHRTSQRVLTLERVDGAPLDDRDALITAGHDIEEILTKAAAIFFRQVFRDGFFHGDQHPGNMWVDAQGRIVAIDFGIMGRLDRKTRFFLADMLLATLGRDYRRLAEVHVEAGYLPPGRPLEAFAQALRAVCEPIFGRPLNEISFAKLLGQLFQLTESFDMPVQPQLLLLQKNMMMAEGVSRRLDPALNIWTLAEPLIAAWMRENRGPEARLRDGAEELLGFMERLPSTLGALEKSARSLAEGGVKLHPETLTAFSRGRSGILPQVALALAIAALLLALAAVLS